MVVVPLAKPANSSQLALGGGGADSNFWMRIAGASGLIAGGILLLNGQRRAGMVAAAAGTALTVLDQKDTVLAWWKAVPELIDEGGRLLDQVQDALRDIAVQREKLREMVGR